MSSGVGVNASGFGAQVQGSNAAMRITAFSSFISARRGRNVRGRGRGGFPAWNAPPWKPSGLRGGALPSISEDSSSLTPEYVYQHGIWRRNRSRFTGDSGEFLPLLPEDQRRALQPQETQLDATETESVTETVQDDASTASSFTLTTSPSSYSPLTAAHDGWSRISSPILSRASSAVQQTPCPALKEVTSPLITPATDRIHYARLATSNSMLQNVSSTCGKAGDNTSKDDAADKRAVLQTHHRSREVSEISDLSYDRTAVQAELHDDSVDRSATSPT
jgi:hypothetical protein